MLFCSCPTIPTRLLSHQPRGLAVRRCDARAQFWWWLFIQLLPSTAVPCHVFVRKNTWALGEVLWRQATGAGPCMSPPIDARAVGHAGAVSARAPGSLRRAAGGTRAALPEAGDRSRREWSFVSLPGRTDLRVKPWGSRRLWLHRWPCLERDGWARWPPKSPPTSLILWFFYNRDGHRHQNISWPHVTPPSQAAGPAQLCVRELKHAFPVFWKSRWFYILTPVLTKKAPKTPPGQPRLSVYVQSVLSGYKPLGPTSRVPRGAFSHPRRTPSELPPCAGKDCAGYAQRLQSESMRNSTAEVRDTYGISNL